MGVSRMKILTCPLAVSANLRAAQYQSLWEMLYGTLPPGSNRHNLSRRRPAGVDSKECGTASSGRMPEDTVPLGVSAQVNLRFHGTDLRRPRISALRCRAHGGAPRDHTDS